MNAAESKFLSNIRANPDDDGVRLVYADWLEENGQPQRAEFIRVQLELAGLPDDDSRREALEDRQDELLAAHGGEWRSVFKYEHPPYEVKFRRGFLDWVVAHSEEEARAVLRKAPLRRLRVRKATGKGMAALVRLPEFVQVRELGMESADGLPLKVRRLVQSPHLALLQSLSLDRDIDGVTDILKAMGLSPHLRALTRLGISSENLDDEGMGVLARSPLLGRLNGLSLSSDEIHLSGMQALLRSPLAAGLTDLELEVNPEIGAAGGEVFASATHLRHLKRLRLPMWHMGPGGAAALASAKHLGSLRCLDLNDNEIGDEGVRAIARAPQWTGLRELDLSMTSIGPDGVQELARSPIWRGLTELSISDAPFLDEARTDLGDAGALALGGSSCLEKLNFCACTMGPRGARAVAGLKFPRLRSLELWGNQMGDEGFAHLLSRMRFPRLRRLDVEICKLTAASVQALVNSPLLDQLTELALSVNSIGDEGAAALAASPRIARLRRLELRECGIGGFGARALAASPYLKHLQNLNIYQWGDRIPRTDSTATALIRRFGDRVSF